MKLIKVISAMIALSPVPRVSSAPRTMKLQFRLRNVARISYEAALAVLWGTREKRMADIE